MKCAEARHVILTADPAALRGRVDASLREHLDGCAPCAADASHVVNDVARLRSALIARGSRAVAVPPRSRNRTIATLIPIALAAELALFALLSNRETVNPLLDRKVIDDSVTTLLPVAHLEIDTGEVVAPSTATRKPRAIATVALTDDTTDDTDSLNTPAASDLPSSPPTAQLQVIPTNHRQRVAIIGTSNPQVTVVWLSKVDSL